MRERAREYSSLYTYENTSEVSEMVERAMNERVTELMYVARELANGKPVVCEEFGRSVSVSSLKELVDTYMGTLDDSIKRMFDLMQNGSKVTRVIAPNGPFEIYRYANDLGDMLHQVRPVGSAGFVDRQLEYGTSAGVEATNGMIINPAGGRVPTYKDDRLNELSIRLDREGVGDGEGHISAKDRDPTSEKGKVSLDIGSVLGRPESFGTKIALIISRGNRLRAARTGSDVSLNHNDTPFDHDKFGTATGFARLAEHMNRMSGTRLAATKVGRRALAQSSPHLKVAA